MPDKIRIGTFRICAVVTPLCSTRGAVRGEYHPGFPLKVNRRMTKIAPDIVQAFSGHEESISVFLGRNMTHLQGV